MTEIPTSDDAPHGAEDGARLTIEFVGEVYQPTADLVFGRDADLCLDDNSYLHRRAGRFRLRAGTWWLENVGSRLRLTMVASDGSVLDLQPGASSPLLGTSGEVSLTAGPTRYRIDYRLHRRQLDFDDTSPLTHPGIDTMTYGPMLTPRELDFVIVLARGRLTGRLGPLPSHGEIAETWGVSAKTVDNTLQRLRSKLRAQNISFVQSSETMVEYLVAQGMVTMVDLEWAALDEPGGPRPAAERRR
ncbi:MAG: helix-turn-helix transcriptional regulator [Acidimicrobiales bacterium]